ncbi:MAG: hypothetical protein ACXW32_14165, partial [Limisphaerales bacterium]
HGLCTRAFLALARTVFAQHRALESIYDFPARLNSRAREWELDHRWRGLIGELLEGTADSFVEHSARLVERAMDPFLRQIFEADLLTLIEFFELAQEMAILGRVCESPVLSQEGLQVSSRLCKLPVSAVG